MVAGLEGLSEHVMYVHYGVDLLDACRAALGLVFAVFFLDVSV